VFGIKELFMQNERIVYSIPEVAEILGLSRSSVYRLVNEGKLEALAVRSLLRVRPSALDRYLDDLQRQYRERMVSRRG
jgi:excisionase family DNA binding protein